MYFASLPPPLKEKESVVLAHVREEFRNIMLPVVVAPPRNQRTPVRVLQEVLGIIHVVSLQSLEEGAACPHQTQSVRPLLQ